MTSDVELLAIEIDTLWDRDARGRLFRASHRDPDDAPYVVIGSAQSGCTFAVGEQVPDPVAQEIQSILEREPRPRDPMIPPIGTMRCVNLLMPVFGAVEVSSGPSYLIPPGTHFDAPAEILTSDAPASKRTGLNAPEQSDWQEDEWEGLITGKLGPWAMAGVDERVISICHSARLSERGAEAGTWTDPSFRGRGYAAAATAAWAALFASSGKTLFYSTDGDNRSSQRVAERLRLPLIGWLWKLAPPSS
jgi:RimJ/RimL family protein N-acetyltransferase